MTVVVPAGGAAGAEAGSEEPGASRCSEPSGGAQSGGETTAPHSQGEEEEEKGDEGDNHRVHTISFNNVHVSFASI